MVKLAEVEAVTNEVIEGLESILSVSSMFKEEGEGVAANDIRRNVDLAIQKLTILSQKLPKSGIVER